MFNFSTSLRQILAALALATCGMAAHADVISNYHVTIDTSSAAGTSGVIDFAMDGLADAPSAFATLSHLQGGFGAIDDSVSHDWSDLGAGKFSLPAVGPSYLSFMVEFGGVFSFDLAFSGDFLSAKSEDVSLFSVFALDDTNFMTIGEMDYAAQFSLANFKGRRGPFVEVSQDAGIADVTTVPEPSALLLMLLGLALAAAALRRRAH